MSQQEHDPSRRRFLRTGLVAIAAVPAGSLIAGTPRSARAAADLPKVSMDDPAAKVLNYHKDATKAPAGERKEGAFCHNCQLYAGEPNSQWGGCNAIPGNGLVSANGWCSAWLSAGAY